MHDPTHVVAELRRPWPKKRVSRNQRNSKDIDPLYRHRQFGPVCLRPPRHKCAHCDDGKVRDPAPSYHEAKGLKPGDECDECLGRGWKRFPLRMRLPYFSWATWRFGATEWYFPGLLTLWHVDPETDGTDSSCRNAFKQEWREARADGDGLREWWARKKMSHYDWFHPHHWRIQVRPLQDLRRWLFTRCAECGKRFPWGYSPVSHNGWDPPRGSFVERWLMGEPNVVHFECDSAWTERHKPAHALQWEESWGHDAAMRMTILGEDEETAARRAEPWQRIREARDDLARMRQKERAEAKPE